MIGFWLVRKGQEIKIIIRQHFVELTVIFVQCTWFVTSKVWGLYVVIPFVPTEKILLYLKNKNFGMQEFIFSMI